MTESTSEHATEDRTSDATDAPDETSVPAPDDPTTETSDACAVCGSPIETTEWHPIATVRNADGELSLYPFCRSDCREDWDGS